MVQDAEKLHEMRVDKLVGWWMTSQACWLMSSVVYWPSNEEGPSLRQGAGSVGDSLSSFSPASTALRSDSPPSTPTLSCLGEPAFFTPKTKVKRSGWIYNNIRFFNVSWKKTLMFTKAIFYWIINIVKTVILWNIITFWKKCFIF